MLELTQIKYSHITRFLNICFKHTNTVPIILGTVGLGKSTIAHEYANQHNLKLIVIPLSSMYEMDLIGYACPNKDKTSFTYLPCDLFPLESTPIPDGYKGFLILLEEFTNCPKSIQTAAQRLLLDKCIGNYKLHPKAYMMAVGNTIEAGTNSIKMNTALRTRSTIVELSVQHNISEIKQYIKKNFHPLWTEFLNTKRILDCYIPSQEEIEDGQTSLGCGRTFHEASKATEAFCKAKSQEEFIEGILSGDSPIYSTISGTIGHKNTKEFVSFLTEVKIKKEIPLDGSNEFIRNGAEQILFEFSLGNDITFVDAILATQTPSVGDALCTEVLKKLSYEKETEAIKRFKQYLTQKKTHIKEFL